MSGIFRLCTIAAALIGSHLVVGCEPVKRLDIDAQIDQRSGDVSDRPPAVEPPPADGGPDQRALPADGPGQPLADAPLDQPRADGPSDLPPAPQDGPPADLVDLPPACPGADGACAPGFVCRNGCVFDPAAVEGLVLWLDAADGVTVEAGRVARWRDRSPLHNDAYQLVSALRPMLQPAAAGSHPAIRFGADPPAASFLRVTDNAKLQLGRDDFLLLLVATARNAVEVHGTFMRKQAALPPYNGLIVFVADGKLSAQLRYADVVVGTPQAGPSAAPFLLSVERKTGVGLRVAVNEQAPATVDPPALDISAAEQDLMIGAHGEDLEVQQLDGEIFEILLVRGPISDTVRAELQAYLKKKYLAP